MDEKPVFSTSSRRALVLAQLVAVSVQLDSTVESRLFHRLARVVDNMSKSETSRCCLQAGYVTSVQSTSDPTASRNAIFHRRPKGNVRHLTGKAELRVNFVYYEIAWETCRLRQSIVCVPYMVSGEKGRSSDRMEQGGCLPVEWV